jgi:hypothetical protein
MSRSLVFSFYFKNLFVFRRKENPLVDYGQLVYNDLVFLYAQVYPQSWTAIRVPLDNVGMWNLRSENWARQYLGQQFYLRVYSPAGSFRDEYSIPNNALKCGRAG